MLSNRWFGDRKGINNVKKHIQLIKKIFSEGLGAPGKNSNKMENIPVEREPW